MTENDVDIQLILEFNSSFGKYRPLHPKNSNRIFFLGHAVHFIISNL
jgi:hypothetical protein